MGFIKEGATNLSEAPVGLAGIGNLRLKHLIFLVDNEDEPSS